MALFLINFYAYSDEESLTEHAQLNIRNPLSPFGVGCIFGFTIVLAGTSSLIVEKEVLLYFLSSLFTLFWCGFNSANSCSFLRKILSLDSDSELNFTSYFPVQELSFGQYSFSFLELCWLVCFWIVYAVVL